MGTQAVVSIRQDGQMAMKVVVGVNGEKARTFAKAIERLGRVPSLAEADALAESIRFGGSEDRVVMTAAQVYSEGALASADEVGWELYRSTFGQPEFNPRWEHGTADYTLIVDF